MKTINTLLLTILLMVSFTACDKEDADTPGTMTTEEAVEIVASALADDSMGASATVTSTTEISNTTLESEAGGRVASCGYTGDSTFSLKGGITIAYDYSYSYSYELTCSELMTPSTMEFEISYNGDVDAPRFSSSNLGTAAWSVAGLELAETSYTLNGSYKRSGTFESKVRNMNATSSNVELTLSDLIVDKGTYEIESGTASVSVSGSLEGKGGFQFTGIVEFLGDKQVVITISGDKYVVDLESGEIEGEA
jgi:hypothetical protein